MISVKKCTEIKDENNKDYQIGSAISVRESEKKVHSELKRRSALTFALSVIVKIPRE